MHLAFEKLPPKIPVSLYSERVAHNSRFTKKRHLQLYLKCLFWVRVDSQFSMIFDLVTKRISHLILARNEQDEQTGEWIVDEEQTLKKKCDFVISAFGSALYSDNIKSALAGVNINRYLFDPCTFFAPK